MKDVYLHNKFTGEILPSTQAIKQFYDDPNHGIFDAWTDELAETDIETDEENCTPDFTKCINI